MVDRPMSAAAFRAWRANAALSERNACAVLGISRGALRRCEVEGAPLYIGLACAALVTHLPPLLTAKDVQHQKKT